VAADRTDRLTRSGQATTRFDGVSRDRRRVEIRELDALMLGCGARRRRAFTRIPYTANFFEASKPQWHLLVRRHLIVAQCAPSSRGAQFDSRAPAPPVPSHVGQAAWLSPSVLCS
jgi:hypothetical protein